MNKLRLFFILLSLLFLHSCTLAPKYQRPCMEMPEQWRVSADETSTIINIRWWEQFNDPVMTELIQEALDSNKDLRAAAGRIAQYQAQLGITRSKLFPQLFGEANFKRERIPKFDKGDAKDQDGNEYGLGYGNEGGRKEGTRIHNEYRATLNVQYELDLWGKIQSATFASYAELLSQVNARRALILSIVSSVASSYILLRQYDAQLIISQKTLKAREESLQLAKIRFEEGLTSELEVTQAASEREETALQVVHFETLIAQQENLLSILIGHPPEAIKRGVTLQEFTLPPEIPAGLPSELLEQRPDIIQAEQVLIAANYRIGEARARFFPEIKLTGFYGSHSLQLSDLFTDPARTWRWAIDLLQPLFTGGRLISELDLAKAKRLEAAYNYLQTILIALKEVNNALIGHQNAKIALEIDRRRINDLEAYLRLATLQYENGLVDYLTVLDAVRHLFDSKLDYAKYQGDVFLSLVDIYKALGGGWVIDAENLMKEEWWQQNCPQN